MTLDLEHFRKKLLDERSLLLEELSRVGKTSSKRPEDWEPNRGEIDIAPSDTEEVAGGLEEYGERTAIEVELEKQLIEVEEALNRIGNGTYGICEKSGKPIEVERLEAFPAARTKREYAM